MNYLKLISLFSFVQEWGLRNLLDSVNEDATQTYCKANQEELENTYKEMELCIKKTQIGFVPKEEFCTHLEQCSKTTFAKIKEGLNEHEKYFPDFILSLFKSLTEFSYDNYDTVSDHLSLCLPKLKSHEVAINYGFCVYGITNRNIDLPAIPPKPMFCKIFIEVSYCFTNLLEQECGYVKDLDKFRQKYINAIKKLCDVHRVQW